MSGPPERPCASMANVAMERRVPPSGSSLRSGRRGDALRRPAVVARRVDFSSAVHMRPHPLLPHPREAATAFAWPARRAPFFDVGSQGLRMFLVSLCFTSTRLKPALFRLVVRAAGGRDMRRSRGEKG